MTDSHPSLTVERLADNLKQVRSRIAAAAERSGRSAKHVRLIAVTKYVDATVTERLCRAGCLELAESRPQQLWTKVEHLAASGMKCAVASDRTSAA